MKSGNVILAVVGAIIRVVVTIGVVFVIYKGALLCYDYGYRIFTEPAMTSGDGRQVTVAITEQAALRTAPTKRASLRKTLPRSRRDP